VYGISDYWSLVHYPALLGTTKNTTFRKLDLFNSSDKRTGDTLLRLLKLTPVTEPLLHSENCIQNGWTDLG
jgi:hypothetical protein